MIYAFEDYELDTDRVELRRSGNICPLERQVFDVLAFLVVNHDRMVSKDELLDEVWQNRFVSESALNSRIMAARRAVGDNGTVQRLIRTIHGRGYRFVGEVTPVTPHAAVSHPMSSRSRLPRPVTSFVGRQNDVRVAVDHLEGESCRLLSLVGPGGIGKTRLAIEVANRVASSFSDVVFVDLQPATDSDSLVSTLADALGVPLDTGAAIDRLANALQSRATLLILDNAEGIVDAAPFLSELLQRTDSTKMLVTSREILNIAEEWVQNVDNLDFPPSDSVDGPESYSSVRLFLARAKQVSPDTFLREDLDAVIEICRLVEGMPLALELAAAWTRTMAPRDIAAAIRSGMDLTSHRRDLSERHRSMASVFGGSWSRLREEERNAFARLSIFRGGFTADAAEAIAAADRDLLSRLLDQSLIRRESSGRFQLHEMLRQFAWSKLQEIEGPEALRDAHANWFLDWYADLAPLLDGHDQAEALRSAQREIENIREAFRWGTRRALMDGRDNAIIALHLDFGLHSRSREGYQALSSVYHSLRAVSKGSQKTATLAGHLSAYHALILGDVANAELRLSGALTSMQELHIHPDDWRGWHPAVGLGIIALIRGDTKSVREYAHACLSTARPNGHPRLEYNAHYLLARAAIVDGLHEEGRDHAERALGLASSAGDKWFSATIMGEIGRASLAVNDLESASRYFKEALTIREHLNDISGIAAARSGLGALAIAEGNPTEAIHHYNESLAANRHVGDRGEVARALSGRAQASILLDDIDVAVQDICEALQLATEIAFVPAIHDILVSAGQLYAHQADYRRAIEFLTIPERFPGSERLTVDRATASLAQIRSLLGDEEFDSAVHAVAAPDLEEATRAILDDLNSSRLTS